MHSISLAQMIRYNESVSLAFYDNEFSLELRNYSFKEAAPFTQIQCPSYKDLSDLKNDIHSIVETKTGKPRVNSTVLTDIIKKGLMIDNDGDSQLIYHHPDRKERNEKERKAVADPFRRLKIASMAKLLESGYIELTVIGGDSVVVEHADSGTEVPLLLDGELDGQQAVYHHEPDTMLMSIALPAQTGVVYRVRLTKNPVIPRLKIFENIPRLSAGNLNIIGYDNVHLSTADDTTVEFLVGEGNTDYTMSRSADKGMLKDAVQPDSVETVPVPVPSVDDLAVDVNGTGIVLSWVNPGHPRFDGVKVVRKAGSAPANATDGTVVYQGTAEELSDTLPTAAIYHYGVFSRDSGGAAADWDTILVDGRTYSIAGWVLTELGGGLAGATLDLVRDDGFTWRTSTDALGRYSFANLGNGAYTLTCAATGYSVDDPERQVTLAGAAAAEDFVALSTVPDAPAGLSATALSADRIRLDWTDTADNEAGFRIERLSDEKATWVWMAQTAPGTNRFTDVNLAPGSPYRYRVQAYNAGGDSG